MSYWKDRQEELYKQLEKDEERLKKRLSSFYSRESRKLENQIASYYTKYGENNVIEYRKMMEKLDDDDIRLLMERMDEFAEKYPQYAHLMPVRESIYKLNRLEGLQTSIKMQQLEIGAINNEELEKHLTKNAHRAVNTTAEALGFGKNFYSIESDIVKKFVGVKWSNDKNFSDRIWGNTEKLANYLNTDVAQGFARGESYQRIMKQMKERFESVSRNDMYRLIYTEGTYVMAEATIKPFEEDFEEYKISTAGDSKVCPVCRKVSEKVFKISERKAGVNFPPFHAWCRCSFIPYVEDWDKWMDDYVEKHEKKYNENLKIIQNRLQEFYFTDDANVRRRIAQKEKLIFKNLYETAYLFDENGNMILEKMGLTHEVQFTEQELSLMGNCILTHNHPLNTTFSPADLYFMKEHRLQETRVTTRYGVYRLRRNKNINKLPTYDDFEKEYIQILSKYSKLYIKKYPDWKKDIEKYQRVIQDNGFNEIAKKYGLDYTKGKDI